MTKLIKKHGLYYPSKEFKKNAWIKNKKIYQEAEENPKKFWENLAKQIFWFKKWKKVFVHNPPYFKWFVNGKINITANIFENSSLGWNQIKDKPALIWEPEPIKEKEKILTYYQLLKEVNKFANVLKKLGVKKGERVGIYMPMIPEAIISMLACARIGAIHSVVFSAFSAEALKIRIQDTNAKILITADGYWRRGKIIDLKKNADQGIKQTKVKKTIIVKRAGNKIKIKKGKDFFWNDLMKNQSDICEPRAMDSEDVLFILYTSGSTGKPKGVIHTCGGYTVQGKFTGKWIFDINKNNIMWCTADIGWVTGHTYGVYSPLLNGASTLIYEGSLDYPNTDRWAKIIEKHKADIFYTAPTAIRMFKKQNSVILKKNRLKTLRLLGSVGEPIDESTWKWYFKEIGREKCPIVDTWWQTETGGILITSLPGIGPFKPSFAGMPFPGIRCDILDEKGRKCQSEKQGNLVILAPFCPGLLRGIYKNPKKYLKTYWSQYNKKIYFTSDAAYKDNQGLIRIVGRTDDVIKTAGHRFTTGEIENAVSKFPNISECAAIGVPDKIKGEALIVFTVLKKQEINQEIREQIKKQIKNQIRKKIGPIVSPKEIFLVYDLPKTRSGKIMRRILKKLFIDQELGDLSTLANPKSISRIKMVLEKERAEN